MAADFTAAHPVPDVAFPEALVDQFIPHLLVEGVVVTPGLEQVGALPLDF